MTEDNESHVNGTYRYLVRVGKLVFYAHTPVGRVLHDYGEGHPTHEVA